MSVGEFYYHFPASPPYHAPAGASASAASFRPARRMNLHQESARPGRGRIRPSGTITWNSAR